MDPVSNKKNLLKKYVGASQKNNRSIKGGAKKSMSIQNQYENGHPGMQGFQYQREGVPQKGDQDYQMNVPSSQNFSGTQSQILDQQAMAPMQPHQYLQSNAEDAKYQPMQPPNILLPPIPTAQFVEGQEGEDPLPMERNLVKVYKEFYLPFDPNKPKTPQKELSGPDKIYRLDLNEEKLEDLHESGMERVKAKYAEEDALAEKERIRAEKIEAGEDPDAVEVEEEKEIEIELNLSDISSSLDSLSSDDMIDFLTKNQVKLSINPLKNVKIDEIGDVKDNFIAPRQIDIINKPTVLFRGGFLKPTEDQTEQAEPNMEEDLKCFNTNVGTQKSSTDTSLYSDISQDNFNDESLEPSVKSKISVVMEANETDEQTNTTGQDGQVHHPSIQDSNMDDSQVTGQQTDRSESQQISSIQQPVHPESVANQQAPLTTVHDLQNPQIPAVEEPAKNQYPPQNPQGYYPQQNANGNPVQTNPQANVAPQNVEQDPRYNANQNMNQPNANGQYYEDVYPHQYFDQNEAYPPQQQNQNQNYGYDYNNNQNGYQNAYPPQQQNYNNSGYQNYNQQSQQQNTVPQQAQNNQTSIAQLENGNYPQMTKEEMKEFLSMYPYMADYPLDEIHRFWYNNIKNENLSGGSLDLNSEEIEKLEGADDNLDESRNSDQIKQELRRKRKRPKKKKNLRKDTGDNNNMIDDISEFSRTTIKPVIPRSDNENNRSRSSSVISNQRSVPENVLLKNSIKDVKSEASGSRPSSPIPKMIHKQNTDKKVRATGRKMSNEQILSKKKIKNFDLTKISPQYEKQMTPVIQSPHIPTLPLSNQVQLSQATHPVRTPQNVKNKTFPTQSPFEQVPPIQAPVQQQPIPTKPFPAVQDQSVPVTRSIEQPQVQQQTQQPVANQNYYQYQNQQNGQNPQIGQSPHHSQQRAQQQQPIAQQEPVYNNIQNQYQQQPVQYNNYAEQDYRYPPQQNSEAYVQDVNYGANPAQVPVQRPPQNAPPQRGYYQYQNGYYYDESNPHAPPPQQVNEQDPYGYQRQDHYYQGYPPQNAQYNDHMYTGGYNQPQHHPQQYAEVHPQQNQPVYQAQVQPGQNLPSNPVYQDQQPTPTNNINGQQPQQYIDPRKQPQGQVNNNLPAPNQNQNQQQAYYQQQPQGMTTQNQNPAGQMTNSQHVKISSSQNNSQQNLSNMQNSNNAVNPPNGISRQSSGIPSNQNLQNMPNISSQAPANYGSQTINPNFNKEVNRQENLANRSAQQEGNVQQRTDPNFVANNNNFNQGSQLTNIDVGIRRKAPIQSIIPVLNTVIPTNIRPSPNTHNQLNQGQGNLNQNMNSPQPTQGGLNINNNTMNPHSTHPPIDQQSNIANGDGQLIQANANTQETLLKDPLAQNEDESLIETSEISLLDQCRHKNHTGRLQRKLREMTDAQRLDVFRELKPHFIDVCCDPYGKYVATLFLGFSKFSPTFKS